MTRRFHAIETAPCLRVTTGSLILFLLAAAGCAPRDPASGISGSGRIEADDVRVGAKIPGRIASLTASEGDRVERGQLLARLDAPEIGARVDRAQAGLEAARAALDQARARVGVLEHHAGKAEIDLERMRALYATGAASSRQVDEAENAYEEMAGQLAAARAAVAEAEASIRERRAALDEAAALAAEREVVSPITGVVLYRLAETGEVLDAGRPIFVLIDPASLHLTVYVAETDIDRVHLGDAASVVLDALAERAFVGTVTKIAEEAQFTPRDVHMADERARLVFAVEIELDNTNGVLKPGMPATAEIGTTAPGTAAPGTGPSP